MRSPMAWGATRSELKAMPSSRLPAELWRDAVIWGRGEFALRGGSRALEWHFAGAAARWVLVWALVESGACRRPALRGVLALRAISEPSSNT